MPDNTDWTTRIRSQLPQCRQTEAARILRLLGRRKLSAGDRERVNALLAESQAAYEARCQVPTHLEFPPSLPITGHVEELRGLLDRHQVLVVAGETGSGKTTQLPKIALEAGRGRRGLVGHTQPRRIAARNVAQRLAEEMHTDLGRAVGYQVRFTDQSSDETLVKVMTDGILLAELTRDRFLDRYDTLIIDEAHERSLNIDFLLGYIKRLLPRRPDLKVIITSATIEVERFSRFFGDAPVVEVSGRTYPVEVRYRPPAEREASEEEGWAASIRECLEEIDAEERGRSKPPGDVLVFLPGEREIRRASRDLRHADLRHTEVLPLYARLSTREQQRVFAPHKGRRVILATNVAETSLTVPGIHYVIDTGLARISRYSVRSKIQRLPVEAVSQASANQRAGRCGRIAPGICFRLYDEADFLGRPEYTDPEIQRTNLAAVILRMTELGLGDIRRFDFLDPPDNRQINDGYKLLEELGAVDKGRRLTDTGRQMARLPVDPRLARMLLAAARLGSLRELLIIAAGLTVQDPRERPPDRQQAADQKHAEFNNSHSDFLALVSLWEHIEEQRQLLTRNQLTRYCQKRFLNPLRLREWREIHHQLLLLARENRLAVNKEAASYEAVHQALLAGLLGQVAVKQEKREYLGTRNRKLTLFPGSALTRSPPKWLMAAEIVETSRVFARTVARIQPEWIEPLAGHLVKRHYSEPHWEKKRAQVMGYERVSLYGLDILAGRSVDYSRIDPVLCRELFIRRALVEGDYRTRAPFVAHNRELVDSILAWEDKTRRRDLLVDDETLFAFYDQRLPDSVVTGRHFERWWKSLSQAEQDALKLRREDLLRGEDPVLSGQEQFPDTLEWQGIRYRLEYRFEPGVEEDGVTIRVPTMALRQLPHHRLDWLVPGLLEEKAVQLVRSLPKSLRRNFVPVPEFVRAALENLSPCNEPLTDRLGAELERMTGVSIPETAWRPELVDSHLFMGIRVVDREGRCLAWSRDPEALLARFEDAADQFVEEAGPGSGAVGSPEPAADPGPARHWSFGPLAESNRVEQGGVEVHVYPSLQDRGEGVVPSQRLDPVKAHRELRRGVARLALLGLGPALADSEKRLPHFKESALFFAPQGRKDTLLDDLLMAAALQHFVPEGEAPPRDREAFERILNQRRGDFYPALEALARQAHEILRRQHQLRKQLKGAVALNLAASLADVKFQLDHLVYPGFLSETPQAWLPALPRYLEAIAIRLEKMPREMGRERAFLHEFKPLWDRYQQRAEALERQGVEDPELIHYRWMLEEYRVSFFAQQLGTAVSVSPQKLDRQWQKVRK